MKCTESKSRRGREGGGEEGWEGGRSGGRAERKRNKPSQRCGERVFGKQMNGEKEAEAGDLAQSLSAHHAGTRT